MHSSTRISKIFDFSSSYSGGGAKRLTAMLSYYNKKGEAVLFIVNDKYKLKERYNENIYITKRSVKIIDRIINRNGTALQLVRKYQPDLYFAYGIPISKDICCKKVLHVSNVLPFSIARNEQTIMSWLKFRLIGHYLENSLKVADLVFGESVSTRNFISERYWSKYNVSYNACALPSLSEQDFSLFDRPGVQYCVVVGTHRHKNLQKSFELYCRKKIELGLEKIIIVGSEKNIPEDLRNNEEVILTGELSHEQVLSILSKSALYICSSSIENSFNALSEAISCAQEIYVKNLPVHKELLDLLSVKYEIKKFSLGEYIKCQKLESELPNSLDWVAILKDFDNIVSGLTKND